MFAAWLMDPKKHKDAEFSYGCGHVNPINATNPGLVYESTEEDYIKILCHLGYSTRTVQKLFNDNTIDCNKLMQTDVTRKDSNYPSMTIKLARTRDPFSATFVRRVTNVGLANSTYEARITKNSDCTITVEPDTLSFKELNEKKTFTVTVKGDQVRSAMISASLIWSDGIHSVRSPIVVY